jgi:hypothetical protein
MQRAWRRESRKYSPMVTPAYGAMYCSGADSEAEATTTVVYAIAPESSSTFTTCATVERFCTMAT